MNLHNRSTDGNNCLPFQNVQRHDGEQALKEGNIDEGKMQSHGQSDGINEHHVLPKRQSEERLAG